MKYINDLREVLLSVWENEPAVVVGAVSAGVVAALGLVGVVAAPATVAIVVTVVIGALVTRLRVSPKK